MGPLIAAWARAFVFTQLVEVPIYRSATKVSYAFAFTLSAVTHPLVWLVFFSPVVTVAYDVRLVSAEVFAVLVEGALLSTRVPRRRAFAIALLANGASVVAGLLARRLVGLP